MRNKVIIALALAAIILSADPSYAASGGRISSGGFRSSPSSGGSSRSSGGSLGGRYSGGYSRPRTAPSIPNPRNYTPAPVYVEPSRPVYVEPRRPSTSIIVLPDLTPPAPPVVVAPPAPTPPAVSTPAPSAVSDPVATPKSTPAAAEEAPSASLSPALILMLLVLGIGVIYVLTKDRLIDEDDNDGGYSGYPTGYYGSVKQSKINVAKVRVALLASAKDIQDDLERLAQNGDTDSEEGLSSILQETTLALMRNPGLIAYSSGELFQGNERDMESLYGKLSMEERSKVSEEVLSNVGGKVSAHPHKGKAPSISNEYILVSLLVATDAPLGTGNINNVDDLRRSLVALGSILPENLMALEIIWQPEGDNEVLTKEELLSLYPDLVSL